ncbi:MAG: polysaccharide deacetylase family protein [Lachnospiraceae bacterium]|nr:polysaccharide deacetylase family protein [Lachnospiraceae bacterium]
MNIKVQCWNLRRKCLNKLRHRKKIALTFDDGHKYADQILEKLEQYGVKSTFFFVWDLY